MLYAKYNHLDPSRISTLHISSLLLKIPYGRNIVGHYPPYHFLHTMNPPHKFFNIGELPDELGLTLRRAEVLLNQIVTDCSPIASTFHFPNERHHNSICTNCPLQVKESLEHLLIRCSGRKQARRYNLGQIRSKSVDDICRNNLSKCWNSWTMRDCSIRAPLEIRKD